MKKKESIFRSKVTTLKIILRLTSAILLPYLVYFFESKEEVFTPTIRTETEEILESHVKGQAGQIQQLWEAGAPSNILSKYYPLWESGNVTYMVPPAISDNILYDSSQVILHNLLKDFGTIKNIGMVVIQRPGSQVPTNSKEYCEESFSETASSTFKLEKMEYLSVKESDITVFYHSRGIMHMEINNANEINNKAFTAAVAKLDESQSLINSFSQSSDNNQWKIIAMPSVQSSHFSRVDFSVLQENANVELLFADNMKSVNSLQKWLLKIFERDSLNIASFSDLDFSQALSYTTTLRHLTPTIKSSYKGEVISSLNFYTNHFSKEEPHNFGSNFPHVMRWWIKLDQLYDHMLDYREEFADTWINSIAAGLKGRNHRAAVQSLDRYLKNSQFILGDQPSILDKILANLISEKYLLPLKHMAKFYKSMSRIYNKIFKGKSSSMKLDSRNSLNKIELKMSKTSFLYDDKPTDEDIDLFEELSCNFNVVDAYMPILLTSEQLEVYEGPLKQVVIGGPGSGKTELLKAKAKELAVKITICNEEFKILYIIATGSPSGDPLLSYQMKKHFANYPPVEVLTVILEEESIELDYFKKLLQNKMAEKTSNGKLKYYHVFIDEYWIGCKPKEHEIIVEMVTKIPGYVWISSVFNFNKERMKTSEKMIQRTGPLLRALESVHGKVSFLHQVVRCSNNIIEVEKKYSYLYKNKTYPYGPEKITSGNIEGLPVTWINSASVMDMYSQCVETVLLAITGGNGNDEKALTLNAANILVVDFAVRCSVLAESVSMTLKQQFKNKGIPVWSFGDPMEDFMDCRIKKITLLSSRTRTESTYLDGVEWPMVVVILPSGVLLNKNIIADGAESLRNYDTYISFFRAQLKLVVISDKWTTSEEFLDDIKVKVK